MKTKYIFLTLVLMACSFFAQAQAYIEKKVTYDPNTPDHYTASLEAFMTETSSTTPVDIVLVVDVSTFSTKVNKTAIGEIKKSVRNLITYLSNNFEDKSNTRLGIVQYDENASILTDALKDLSQSGVSALNSATDNISLGNAHSNASLGLSSAESLLSNSGDREKIVILLMFSAPSNTSGRPNGNMTTAQYTSFNEALNEAYDLKITSNATIFVVGKSNDGYYDWTQGNGYVKTKDGILLSRFSSKYPDTGSIKTSGASSGIWTPTFYKGKTGKDTSTSSADGDYVYVAPTITESDLDDALTSIADDIKTRISTSLDPSKLSVADVIGDQMKYAGSDNSQISLFKSKCTKLEGGVYVFDDANKTSITATKNISNNTVTVSGYDFVANKVSGTATSGEGYKLIVQYPMIIKSAAAVPGTLTTGTDGSGILNDGTVMQALTPASVNVCKIQVSISGLQKGESATFNVYKLDGSNNRVSNTPVARLIATRASEDTSGSASTSCIVPEAGNYEVEESGWNWPYTLTTPSGGSRSIKQAVSVSSTTDFVFTNGSSRTSPNHNEHRGTIATIK